jgi:hypothetical protein
LSLQVSPDGLNYSPPLKPFRIESIRKGEAEANAICWWIDQVVRSWQISTKHVAPDIEIGEIIVLVPDDTKPLLPVIYPDSIEVLTTGTTNLDFFSGLSNISDGDDNTYATFAFRGGYSVYTLYLRGTFSIPMATVISPFALIEIDPQSSNLATVINQNIKESHGYFHWGASDSVSYSGYAGTYDPIEKVSNRPRLRWSQKAYEYVDGSTPWLVIGTLTDSILQPDNADPNHIALTAPLDPSLILNRKTLYIPYFFSLRYWPIFVAHSGFGYEYIRYATDDLVEPFVYTAANGTTGKITLNFGLRIATTSIVSRPFAVKLYSMGFLCFPQMDFEAPLGFSPNAVWFDHVPQGNVTRDNNELTESTDIVSGEKFVVVYPTAIDISSESGQAIRFRIRSASDGNSNFTIKRYYGFHSANDNTILWYSLRTDHNVGVTLQSFDVLGEDQYGQTKVIKVEILPFEGI